MTDWTFAEPPPGGDPPPVSAELRMDEPHTARVYDFLLGGKTNFNADREAAERGLRTFPNLRVAARQNRAFVVRAVTTLAQLGIRQFLDVGTGIPTTPNVHEAAQRAVPSARVVYVDNDPIVLVHARALMTSTRDGRTDYIQADLRHPESILAAPALTSVLDLSEPVAVVFGAVLHFLSDEEAHAAVRALVGAVPSGSRLVISHGTTDFAPAQASALVSVYDSSVTATVARSKDQVEAFFKNLELEDPGVVPAHRWRPGPEPSEVADSAVSFYAGVGRKP